MKRLAVALCILCLAVTATAQETESTETEPQEKRKAKFVPLPIINYYPVFGWNFAAVGMLFFPMSQKDTESPLSIVGAGGGYTTNKTWYGVLGSKLYLAEDKWRVTLAFGRASMNFQFFLDIPNVGGSFIDYTTLYSFGYAEFQRRIIPTWYLGGRFMLMRTKTTFDVPGIDAEELTNMNNIGFVLVKDSRDNVYNPTTGTNLNLKTGHYRSSVGSDFNFDNYEFDYNKFIKLDEQRVLVARFAANIATGEVPFEGQNVVGRDDIRGYTDGKHRAEQVYALQSEYRWNIYKKWGMVAFAGLATAVNSLSEFSFDGLLPGAGVGIRYMAVPSEKINVGIDVAVGKDDWGLYFRIGESFGK
jgi:outer membrane protein assembly factor BamA